MNTYDLVIFDVDGTLLDTSEGIMSAVRHTIEKKGLKMLTDDEIAKFIGPPIQESFAKAYGLDGDILQELATVFREFYKGTDLLKAVPYEGIYNVFQQLADKGVMTAIATYKREDYAIRLLKHFGFDKYTENMHGGDDKNQLKKKEIIEQCIRESCILDKSRVVMVGDTVHDAMGAELVGVDFIGVTYGFGFCSRDDLSDVSSIGCASCALDIMDYI